MARAMWGIGRTLVGFSDVFLATLLPYTAFVYALSVGLVGTADRTTLALAAASATAVGFVVSAILEGRRRTGYATWFAMVWLFVALVGGAVILIAAILSSKHYAWLGYGALGGAAIAGIGLLTDLVVTIVRAFGVGRERVELRPGAFAAKVALLAGSIALATQTAGSVGAHELPRLVLLGFWIGTFASGLSALLACGLFARHASREPEGESLPSTETDRTIARRSRRGRAGARTSRSRSRAALDADADDGGE